MLDDEGRQSAAHGVSENQSGEEEHVESSPPDVWEEMRRAWQADKRHKQLQRALEPAAHGTSENQSGEEEHIGKQSAGCMGGDAARVGS